MMRLWIGLFVIVLFVLSCSKDEGGEEVILDPPEYVSCDLDGATDVNPGNITVTIIYSRIVSLIRPHGITINNEDVINAKAEYEKVFVDVTLEDATSYVLNIPAGIVKAYDGSTAEEVNIAFSTKGPVIIKIDSALCVQNSSQQAVNVYNFLKDNYGKKMISSTMANVSWNINEAEWVYRHTGKYPAMTTFDYVHLASSPANWIDYSVTTIQENWWNENGLIAAGWHWNVPKSEGSSEISFYTDQTSFDASNATTDGTWENDVVKADLEKVAGYLKLLQQKNIPIIWRPLHEAAGNVYNGGTAWFWWGASGADAYKNLWHYMFDYFQSQGLNNLIWVWTTQTKDHEYYPGDDYVDIVGKDIYGNYDASSIADLFNAIQVEYPNKMVTLSECGTVANISSQWEAGAKWSYFMPWYDYDRTKDVNSADFDLTDHIHASIDWWNDAFNCSYVLTRDQMPSLK